jgi:hypothetical protein
MKEDQVQATQEGRRWRRTPELPQDVFAVLRKSNRAINPITIVATVDPDGTPRTAPFGSLRAVTPGLLRLGCQRFHDTYANLCRDGRVAVALLAPPNIAVSIRGRARVVKEGVDANEQIAIVEIDVEEVKNDMMARGVIESAIELSLPESLIDYYMTLIDQVEGM